MMLEFLLRSTLLLSVGTIVLLVLGLYLPIRSAKVQRLAWLAVLLQGVLFVGVSWEIPFYSTKFSELKEPESVETETIIDDFGSEEIRANFLDTALPPTEAHKVAGGETYSSNPRLAVPLENTPPTVAHNAAL
jgi:hypothetical protein